MVRAGAALGRRVALHVRPFRVSEPLIRFQDSMDVLDHNKDVGPSGYHEL